MTRVHVSTVLLVLAVVLQIAFASRLKHIHPYWTVLPPVPTERSLTASAFGDTQFLYRSLVMDMQNFGDTGGHRTALKDYDMTQVIAWLRTLDSLDLFAQHHVALAARYFSQTQHKPDVEPLVRYIQEHVAKNPQRKFQWLGDAISLSTVRLRNNALAVEVADQLSAYDYPEMTIMAYELPAMVHENTGDYGGAARLMALALQRLKGRAPDNEIHYMENYIAAMRDRAATGPGSAATPESLLK